MKSALGFWLWMRARWTLASLQAVSCGVFLILACENKREHIGKSPCQHGISWISDSWAQHGVHATDSRHTFTPGLLHFQSHQWQHRDAPVAANFMFCLVFFFSCPLQACLNGWRWWMRVKNTLQVGFGYNLSWEGGEDEGIRGGGIEGGMVYRWDCWVGEVEGQDVCLPMSRDSERKRRGEWDERRVMGEERRESIFTQRRNHV